MRASHMGNGSEDIGIRNQNSEHDQGATLSEGESAILSYSV